MQERSNTLIVSRADLAQFELGFLALWRFLHQLHAELESDTAVRQHLPALRVALDRALQDYTNWHIVKQSWGDIGRL